MSNKQRLLWPILLLSSLSGCETVSTAPVVVSEFCRVAKPIEYDGAADTPETVRQVEAHNLRWQELCDPGE